MHPRRIMVTLPGPGELGPIAIDKVSTLARALEADVELFHCVHGSESAPPAIFAAPGAQEMIHRSVAARRRNLEALADRMRSGGVRVSTSVRWDRPTYAGIVRQVLRHKPTLLVACPTRKGPIARRLLGRTDFSLIEACPCPVLFIKTRRPYADSVLLAAVDPGHAHGKPAALDAEILGWASRLREALPGKLVLFHAHAPLERSAELQRRLRECPEPVRADMAAAWRHSLQAGALALAQEYAVPQHLVRIAEGAAADALERVAHEVMADIVIMGAAGRSPAGRLIFGHTAERALDALESDVLIVKPPGFRSHVNPQSAHHVRRSSAWAGRIF